MPLTDTTIRNAKPKEKPYKLSDGNGLYLLVKQAGKYFRMNYRFGGKSRTIAFGVYPRVKLKDARQKCHDARALLERDIDPMQYKKEAKFRKREQAENSFEKIALEWFLKNKHTWTEKHAKTIMSRLENNIFPWLGSRPIDDITPSDLLLVLRRIEDRGAVEVAHRTKQICGQVFRYGIATGRAGRDISADLKGALMPTKSKNLSAITEPVKVGELLRAIDGYSGNFVTKCALRLAPLVFLRPIELRHAEWSEIDLDNYEWKIPGPKMKKKRPHIIPLSFQSADIFKEILPLTGDGRYVFPSIRSNDRALSENALTAALRRMGFEKHEMCAHGFRGTASTLLHENGWASHLIELQLAHVEKNSVKAAYNHAEHLEDRRKMMQWWADYLDELRAKK